MTQQSWLARQMKPRKDNIATMALHYGLTPTDIQNVVLEAGAELVREDGFVGKLEMVVSKITLSGEPRNRSRKVIGWSDGEAGVNSETTKLTRDAITAVAKWKHIITDYENL